MSKMDEVKKRIQWKKSEMIKVEGTKKVQETKNHFGRSNKKKDRSIQEVINNMTLDIIEWRKRRHMTNPN